RDVDRQLLLEREARGAAVGRADADQVRAPDLVVEADPGPEAAAGDRERSVVRVGAAAAAGRLEAEALRLAAVLIAGSQAADRGVRGLVLPDRAVRERNAARRVVRVGDADRELLLERQGAAVGRPHPDR